MKVPQSIRLLYEDLRPKYENLKEAVDSRIVGTKESRWHYESRVKEVESFALKLETGREWSPASPEDLFGATIVVENHSRIVDAENYIHGLFQPDSRRPKDGRITHLQPYSFDFDELRLYVRWADDPLQRPTGLQGLLFEIQIKTFLQHAWGIATHDFIYKSDDCDWPASRIAYQVKAMLENAELTIGEAKNLTSSSMLSRSDYESNGLRAVIAEIRKRWDTLQLPGDLLRLARNIDEMCWKLDIDLKRMWECVDEATAAGDGTKTLNLSPYSIVLTSLVQKMGPALFDAFSKRPAKHRIFVPLEVDLPSLPGTLLAKFIRPPASAPVSAISPAHATGVPSA